jgi:hypothetical protein
LDFARGTQFPCPACEELCGHYDSVLKRWRHLNFFQYRCELVAAVPRLRCSQHGVHLVSVPWATEGSGFTLLFEAFVMLLAQQMPVAAIARLVDEEDTRLWRLIARVVNQAHAAADWSEVSSIAIDETSSRRGRWYVTVFLDAQTHRLLYVAEGRSSLAVEQFAQALVAHGGRWPTHPMGRHRHAALLRQRGARTLSQGPNRLRSLSSDGHGRGSAGRTGRRVPAAELIQLSAKGRSRPRPVVSPLNISERRKWAQETIGSNALVLFTGRRAAVSGRKESDNANARGTDPSER